MNIMIIGSGGREHALAWKIAQSKRAERIFVVPGNAGTALEPRVENVPLDPADFPALINFARGRGVDLCIVGPEAPLVSGIVDHFQAAGLRCFGPSAAAARLEGSKAFTKDFLKRHGIPTAEYANFTEIDPAIQYVRSRSLPIVIKADGLAAGKGVVIAQSLDEAEATIRDMLSGNRFGPAGYRVVIEEFMRGEEATFIVLVDGRNALPFASSQDHKAIEDGDRGPNTGGMGAYSPAPVVTPEVHARVMREIIHPTVSGMAAEGNTYVGFLYAGLMIGEDGAPKVVEFNCRFGDPEAQPVMMRLKNDLVELCEAALEGRLSGTTIDFDERVALGVVMAAGGYPGSYAKGDWITGLDRADDTPDCKVFHAGTAFRDGKLVTNGGRVLCVTALGGSVSEAQTRAYARAERIQWDKVYYRKDIGYRAIAREREQGS